MTKLYFVRHGESVSNLMTQFAGSLDMPLTDKGRQQAKMTAEYLRDVSISCVYSSDLSRAYETGCSIANERGVPIVSTSQLREIFAGDWEGKTYHQLEVDFSESYYVWKTQIGLAQCPSGETVSQLQQRIRQCVDDIVSRHPNETVCITTHATPIRVMECVWTDTPLAQMHSIPWVSNASITIAEYDEDGVGRLVARDQHDHLGDILTVLAENV